MSTTAIRVPGFVDPVGDAQQVFRAALEALARPTLPQPVQTTVLPPAPLGTVAGALVLTLCDEQTPVWLDQALRHDDEVVTWIGFHTGARIVDDAADALFCVASSAGAVPPIETLAQGTDEEPHRSATVIIDAAGVRSTALMTATGPGVDGEVDWDGAGLPASRPDGSGFLTSWAENNARYPRGVDLLLAGDGEVRGLPRTTVLSVSERTTTGHRQGSEHALAQKEVR